MQILGRNLNRNIKFKDGEKGKRGAIGNKLVNVGYFISGSVTTRLMIMQHVNFGVYQAEICSPEGVSGAKKFCLQMYSDPLE